MIESLRITCLNAAGVKETAPPKELANSNKKCGIIKEIYTKIKGSRPVAYARVFLISDDIFSDDEVLIIRLNLLSKHKKDN